ncbi:hypothetical protein HK104_008131 [Borealophlyctis nickersoniae]|nr:hypothetical protein HK104_008131 [Borealophlyctis nickersoniae]
MQQQQQQQGQQPLAQQFYATPFPYYLPMQYPFLIPSQPNRRASGYVLAAPQHQQHLQQQQQQQQSVDPGMFKPRAEPALKEVENHDGGGAGAGGEDNGEDETAAAELLLDAAHIMNRRASMGVNGVLGAGAGAGAGVGAGMNGRRDWRAW